LVKLIFETIMKAECDNYLTTNKDLNNKGNGYYTRLAQILNKYMELKVPRDRLSMFQPVF